MNRIPRLTRWAMWHADSDTTGDRLVGALCAAVAFLFAIGVIR